MLNYLYLFIFSFILGVLLNAILRIFSLKSNFFRSEKGIPYSGGLGIFLSFIVCYLLFNFINGIALPFHILWVIIFASVLLGIEFIDDWKDFSLSTRVIIQIIFISLFLFLGKRMQIYFIPSWLNYVLSFLWIMGITNAFNHLDISDGLCGGVSLIVGLSFLTVSLIKGDILLAGLFSSLCGVLLSFLLFNFPPAKILMGNSGSHLLGFLFATLSMYGDYATLENPFALTAPLLILAFPIIDTGYIIIMRLKKRMVPLRKSNDHIFLRLISLVPNTKNILLSIYTVCLLWGLSGIFIIFGFNLFFLAFITLAILSTLKLILKMRFSH